MLSGILGTRLLFWAGGTIPTPPPSAVLDALTRVEVTEDEHEGSGFQISFSMSANEIGDYPLLRESVIAPFSRVWLAVVLGITPEILIDGIITHQQVTPAPDGGTATLTLTGRDVSLMLDLEEKSEKYENQSDSIIVTQILARYAQYGLVPQVTSTTDFPIVVQRTPWQTETDLKFIQRLAQRNGYVFYVQAATMGVNNAYFGPPTRIAPPQPALTLGMGADSNVTSLHVSSDSLSPVSAQGTMVEPMSKQTIPIPSLPSLRLPPLASSPLSARRKTLLRDSSRLSPAQSAAAAVSAPSLAPEPVTVQGEMETVRYGTVLRARRIVGVRGVGTSLGGNYWVRRVTNTIDRSGTCTQTFVLTREGPGTLLPVVMP